MRSQISLLDQIKYSTFSLCGPPVLINVFVLTFLFDYFLHVDSSIPAIPSLIAFVSQLFLMLFVGDFWLYWGHRIQHEVDFLWRNLHYFHHQIGTPTPFTAGYINSIDATIQTGLPIALSAIMIRSHPFTIYAFILMRVSDSVVSHCGINSSILNVVTFRFLPTRASISHHDSHHKYMNFSKHAKNYGEAFWFWDWLFGTLGSTDRYKLN